MSYSSTRTSLDKLVTEHEAKRRADAYGVRAKVFQLVILSSVAAVIYLACTVRLWLFTSPLKTVLIDGVVVDIVSDDTTAHWLARASGTVFVFAVGCMGVVKLELNKVLFSAPVAPTPAPSAHPPVVGQCTNAPSALSIVQRSSTSLSGVGEAMWWNSGSNPSARSGAVANVADPAVRTLDELEALIQQRRFEQPTQRSNDDPYHRPQGFASSAVSSLVPGMLAPTNGHRGGIAVRYQNPLSIMSNDGNQRQAATAESELSALGVLHPERSLAKLRQWAAGICKAVVEDIDKCDAWLSEQRVRGFDCSCLLSEEISVVGARPPVSGGFGGFGGSTMQPAAAQPEKIRKYDALQNEKRKHQTQNASSMETYDWMHRIDLRLSLEHVLDVSGTFPNIGGGPSNAQAAARMRQGVIQRLRDLGQSRNLSSMSCSSDKPYVPADPYILTHILRMRVPCLANYIQLPYAVSSSGSGGGARDLRIYVGGNGDPYFYVRHRSGLQEKHMNTTEGPDSLFEALLLFFAVIQRVYHGAYGNVEGVVDLKQLNLDAML